MYESTIGTTTAALQSSNTAVFTDDTIARIIALSTKDNSTVNFETVTPDASGNTTVGAGAEVVLVSSSDTTVTKIIPPQNAPVVIFQGKGGIDATFQDANAPQHVAGVTDRVVVGSAGNDHIVIADAKNTQITLGTGNSTVTTGQGADTVVAGLGNSTVVGGTSDSVVQLHGNAADYTVTVQGNHAIVTDNSTGTHTDISKLQYVQLDNKDALIFADDTEQAAVSVLYHAALGRTADAAGLQYWLDLAAAGQELYQIGNAMTASLEFNDEAGLSNNAFVQNLYANTFDRAADAAGLDFWLGRLDAGATRGQLIAAFAEIAAQNIDQTLTTEPIVVGQVTIIHDIV